MRSEEKADLLQQRYPEDALEFSIVTELADPHAFDSAVVSDPPFDYVLHTASPYHFHGKDFQKDYLDPAINGTLGIMKAVHAFAPTVKQIVVTSSFAAIMDGSKGAWPGKMYTAEDWSPIKKEDVKGPHDAYLASKKYAELAAWDYMKEYKPSYALTVLAPPVVFGPNSYASLDSMNTSNSRITDFIRGVHKTIPPTPLYSFVDVRDLALAHVRAIETPNARGCRILMGAGPFNMTRIAQILRDNFPDLASVVPEPGDATGYPEGGCYTMDARDAKSILNIKFRSLEEAVRDCVLSVRS